MYFVFTVVSEFSFQQSLPLHKEKREHTFMQLSKLTLFHSKNKIVAKIMTLKTYTTLNSEKL